MKPRDPVEFRYLLRRLDHDAVVAFVADLWAATGWETSIDGAIVTARRETPAPETRRVAVATAPGIIRGATLPSGAADADVVVVPGRPYGRAIAAFDGPVYDVDDLYDRCYYAIDRSTSAELLSAHFGMAGVVSDDAGPGLAARASELVWRARTSPLEATMVIALVAILVVGATATGVWLSESPGAPADIQTPETPLPSPVGGAIGSTPGATIEPGASPTPTATPVQPAFDIEPPRAKEAGDWSMFQFDARRTGFNPAATGPASGASLEMNGTHIESQIFSSPAVVGGRVYVGTMAGELLILDAESLSVIRGVAVGERVSSSPAVVNGTIYVGASDDPFRPTPTSIVAQSVSAVNATTGRNTYLNTSIGVSFSSPLVHDGTLYVGGVDGRVYAIDIAAETLRWSVRTNGTVFSSPALWNDTVYVGSSDGHLYALNASSGQERWRFGTGGEVVATPAVTDGRVVVGSLDGRMYAVNATTGDAVWNTSLGDGIYASPTVAYDTVYVGSIGESFYALSAQTGAIQWAKPVDGPIDGSAAIASGTAYIGTNSGTLYALDAPSGQERWSIHLSVPFSSSPAVAHGSVYAATSNGTIIRVFGTAADESQNSTTASMDTVGRAPSRFIGPIARGLAS